MSDRTQQRLTLGAKLQTLAEAAELIGRYYFMRGAGMYGPDQAAAESSAIETVLRTRQEIVEMFDAATAQPAHPDLLRRAQDEADLCRQEGASDIAALLDEVAAALAQPAQAVPTQADLCAQIAKNLGSGWLVIGPDGSAFQADTPHRAANEASKHCSRMLFDPAKAAEFDGLIADVRRRNEESNAQLEALLGTLNCPTCGGSGHVEDAIARMGREAQPAQADACDAPALCPACGAEDGGTTCGMPNCGLLTGGADLPAQPAQAVPPSA